MSAYCRYKANLPVDTNSRGYTPLGTQHAATPYGNYPQANYNAYPGFSAYQANNMHGGTPFATNPNTTTNQASFVSKIYDKPAPAATPFPNISSGHKKTDKKTAAKKPYPCEYDGCPKTFTRRGDVRRHMETASEHKPDIPQGTDSAHRCKRCNEELSRPDARRRHEERGACGTRRIPRSESYPESNRLLWYAFGRAK
ncbi:hypothetical protein BDQ12DRAFT_162431 [Crucibulum laeve]|uniref:C2H2-type domain-containing protein n=1 Tax=Crucibulum laeve TaxID=68775 RepID=A0A5C3MPA8_9AGAR|nr:hypothetical protein BDQ12DRAFT_162431 [Crucibulum laeve]